MNIIDIIYKKRERGALSKEEIFFVATNYCDGEIPDYQMSALLMAIFFQGMNKEEIFELTRAFIESGKRINIDSKKPKIDKHSTGGVGDGTSLVLAPLVSSCDVLVPMVCGKGLGHTGGTIDKLQSIPGFKTEFSFEEFAKSLKRCGVAIMSQTEDIAPLDKKTYRLKHYE